MRKLSIISLLFVLSLEVKALDVRFYSDTLVFYEAVSTKAYTSIEGDFKLLDESKEFNNLDWLFKQLVTYKEEYKLNDFLTYKLLVSFSESYFGNGNQKQKSVLVYKILTKMGFDVIPKYDLTKGYILSVRLEYKFGEGDNANYHIIYPQFLSSSRYRLIKVKKRKSWNLFSFQFKEPILFKNDSLISKKITFKLGEVLFEKELQFSKSVIQLLGEIPKVHFCSYNSFVSKILLESFNREVLPILKEKEVSIKKLLSFVRTSSKYQVDKVEKHYFIDEFLFYNLSDCEDFSMSFATLLATYIGVKYVYLDYGNHLNIAFENIYNMKCKEDLLYRGKKYIICEPTDPYNSIEIGDNLDRKILGKFECIFP